MATKKKRENNFTGSVFHIGAQKLAKRSGQYSAARAERHVSVYSQYKTIKQMRGRAGKKKLAKNANLVARDFSSRERGRARGMPVENARHAKVESKRKAF